MILIIPWNNYRHHSMISELVLSDTVFICCHHSTRDVLSLQHIPLMMALALTITIEKHLIYHNIINIAVLFTTEETPFIESSP